MITDAFDWTWQSGSTPTLMTGPSADHTGGNILSLYVLLQMVGDNIQKVKIMDKTMESVSDNFDHFIPLF